jgi:RimJ/RimL family protein N-acetyltransferase
VSAGSVSLGELWPLFGLRLRTSRLELRLPTDDELPALMAVARDGIHPPDEMPFAVPWTRATGAEFERGFLQHHWRIRGAWSPEDWALNLAAYRDGEPVGSQTVGAESFAVRGVVDTGSWLGQRFQGHGLGKEMRAGVLALAFDGLGAREARSEAFEDNPASAAVSRALGYEQDGDEWKVVEGRPRRAQRFRITRERWAARPRLEAALAGLEPCRSLFGAG